MVLDKTLLLKGLAGVVSIGGVAVGGYYISGSGKSEKKQVNKPINVAPGGVNEVDDLGIPRDCETKKECDITKDQIKKIKFKDLGDEGDVTVENFPSGNEQKITLKIEGENDSKKYIFTNSSSTAVTIKRGVGEDKKVTLKGSGKTRFTVDDKKLKLLEPGSYGLPSRCVNNTPCNLTKDDLGLIKFSGFADDGEATVGDFSTNQTITLTQEDGKYIFTNNSSPSINIAKGSVTVTIDANGESEFKVDNEKLKKVEFGEFGFPSECDNSGDAGCQLSEKYLKKVKFKNIGENPTVTGLTGAQKVTLKIQNATGDDASSYPGGKKYIFSHNASGEIKIISSSNPQQSITLSKTEENIFKKEESYLVKVTKVRSVVSNTNPLDEKIKGLGLPDDCTFSKKATKNEKSIECELSKDQIKVLKFANKEGNEFTVSSMDGDERNYKIKIEETENEDNFKDKNIRVTFLNRDNNSWTKQLILNTSEGEPLIIYNNSNTEFKINSSNKLEKAWKTENLSALVGLKCPKGEDSSGDECILKENDGSIKVFLNDQEKDFKPADSSTIESNISFAEDQNDFSQGIEFKVSNSTITGTNKDKSSESLELVVVSYEIRRINGKGWRLAKKAVTQPSNFPSLG